MLPRNAIAANEENWVAQAVRLYDAYYSVREVALTLSRLYGVKVTQSRVDETLRQRGVLKREVRDCFRYEDLRKPNSAHLDELVASIEEALRTARALGRTTAELDALLRQTIAQQGTVDHACYVRDELFNSREAVATYSAAIKEYHATNQEAIAGFGFESFLANAWEKMGIKVVMGPSNFEGADHLIEREQQNDWVAIAPTAISVKSENRTEASKRTINIDSLARHDVRISTAADCVKAVKHAVDHLRKYQRMIYLKSTESTFPDDDDRPAHRYQLFEVRKNDMQKRLKDLTAADFRKCLRAGESFKTSNAFNVPIYDEKGRKLFSVTVTREPPHVRIYSIALNYCSPITSYWTEPLPDRRVDEETARGATARSKKRRQSK